MGRAHVVVVVPTVVVDVVVAITVVIVSAGPVVVDVIGARGNLDAQKLCAAGAPATFEASSPTTPLHDAAETKAVEKRELYHKLTRNVFMFLYNTYKLCNRERQRCRKFIVL